VEIAPRFWRWLGFQWGGKYYEFCSLPFGLAPACRTFTLLVRALAAHWRSQGIRMVHYIDDWVFFCHPSEHAALTRRIIADIKASGFIINQEKSHGLERPTFQFDWIGYSFDLRKGTYGVLAHHESHLQEQCKAFARLQPGNRLKAIKIMQFTGKLASAHRLLGPALRMFCFSLNRLAASVRHKNHYLKWTVDGAREVEFWNKNFARLNSAAIWPQRVWAPCFARVRCDAGEPGWGMYIDRGRSQAEIPPDCDIAHGFWTRSEKRKSSTWRELKGFLLGFKSLIVPLFAGRRVLVFVDAKNVETLWQKGGSSNPEHHAMILELYLAAEAAGITLEIQWVPREENTCADAISKFCDESDWKIALQIFRRLERRWGSPVVDLFASHLNMAVPRFFSRYWCPGTAGVDAFARDWSDFSLCWCNPPFAIMADVLAHATECGARLILIAPEWRQQPWWPRLRSPDGRGWAAFVEDSVFLPKDSGTFLPGVQEGFGAPTYACWALLCNFRHAP
jgi:hypothetical protein